VKKVPIENNEPDLLHSEVVEEPVLLKNVYHTRLIIPMENTVSGMAYSFEVGEVKSILLIDKEYLLSLSKQMASCCGGIVGKKLNYFEEVK